MRRKHGGTDAAQKQKCRDITEDNIVAADKYCQQQIAYSKGKYNEAEAKRNGTPPDTKSKNLTQMEDEENKQISLTADFRGFEAGQKCKEGIHREYANIR